MSHRYSTALSHAILAGTGIYCFVAIKGQKLHFPHATYGIIAVNSLLGIWRWGNPDHGSSVDKPYNFTTFLQTLFALPCITTTIWLGHYQWELAYAHTLVSLIPLVAYLLDSNASGNLVELILLVNSVSLGVVSFLHENYYGVAAAVSYAIAHFCFREGSTSSDVPALDLYNYALCFFSYFSLRALGGA